MWTRRIDFRAPNAASRWKKYLKGNFIAVPVKNMNRIGELYYICLNKFFALPSILIPLFIILFFILYFLHCIFYMILECFLYGKKNHLSNPLSIGVRDWMISAVRWWFGNEGLD